MSGGNRNNGAADAVQKVVLVCGCVPECICVCRIFERISDRYVVLGGAFTVGTAVGIAIAVILLILLFRPDPYKNEKNIFQTVGTGGVEKISLERRRVMAADILIISLIASYCIFLIYKARKTQKREKRPGVPDAAETVVRVQAARRVRERQKIKRCRTE